LHHQSEEFKFEYFVEADDDLDVDSAEFVHYYYPDDGECVPDIHGVHD
jgi:hypothetical protein